jgi:hypothetical protein
MFIATQTGRADRGVHAVTERANALLKVTFQDSTSVSLDPGAIARIALALFFSCNLSTAVPHGQDHKPIGHKPVSRRSMRP